MSYVSRSLPSRPSRFGMVLLTVLGSSHNSLPCSEPAYSLPVTFLRKNASNTPSAAELSVPSAPTYSVKRHTSRP